MKERCHTLSSSYRVFALLGSLVLISIATMPNVEAAVLNHSREYARCMALAPSDPDEAFEMATAWRELGGGDAAEHCAAVALLYAGQPDFAGRRLEVLAETIVAEPDFKGRILAQAGQAWLLHGDAARAEAALTSAMELLRPRPELMVDRAQARAALGDYEAAVEDLSAAILADPRRVDAYTFRASAYRYLDRLKEARVDIDQALALNPNHLGALLESGIIYRLAANEGAARKAWMRILEIQPSSDAGSLARANIEKMDLKVE